jgi:8-oxo-dGTP pyrophosphatase MutT (NUDIX family)
MKLPSNAKKVFSGIIYDIYQWPQKMYDGTTHIFEGIKRANTVLVIPTIGNKIIITHQEQPDKPKYFSLLGGRGEKEEQPLATAKRELKEESGLESDDWELYAIYDNFSKFDWEIYTYIARDCKKVSHQRLDPGEKITLLEVSFNEFIDMHTQDGFWGGEMTIDILKMKLDPKKLEAFRRKVFNV